MIGYGTARFFIEYLREPDRQLGFILALGEQTEPTALFLSPLNFSMGQLLSAMMILAGILFLMLRGRKKYLKKS
jgi:phosphatidylglycerol:prolipoprotein diacylglycerol transferase